MICTCLLYTIWETTVILLVSFIRISSTRTLFHRAIFILRKKKRIRTVSVITGRNEVLAKVMFLQASVILSTGGVCSNFLGEGCAPFFGGGVLQFFGGVLQFFGGGVLQFLGGALIFRGGCSNFSGGVLEIFGGVSTGIRSTFGRYASYWNAFLFLKMRTAIHFSKQTSPMFKAMFYELILETIKVCTCLPQGDR